MGRILSFSPHRLCELFWENTFLVVLRDLVENGIFEKLCSRFFPAFCENMGLSIKEREVRAGKNYLVTYSGPVLPFEVFVNLVFSFREKPKYTSYSVVRTPFPVLFTDFVHHLEPREVLAEKLRAILTRSKGRDLFDTWFLLAKGVKIDWDLVGRKMAYYPEVDWSKDRIAAAVNGYPFSKFKKDLRPFLPLDYRKKLESIYKTVQKVVLEELP